MKTIKQWFEQAKEQGYEWADSALQYAEDYYNAEYYDNPEDVMADSLKNAIDSGFCWEDTEEGEDYWFDIWKTLDYK